MSILIREHFIHSTQTPLTAWSILINNEYYIPNLQVFLASLHFFCMLSVDRYSSLQHFQNTLTRVAGEGITILETMTNNNRVGSNVDFFCKPYCTFWSEPTWPELARPPFSLRKLFKTVPLTSTSTVCNSSKHKVDQSSTFFRGVLIPLTSHSKNPPHHGALSVIKFMKFFG